MKFRLLILLNLICSALIFSQTYNPLNSTFLYVDFESNAFPPKSWTLDTTQTNFWSRVTSISGYGIGNGSAKFDFYNAAFGITQSLISPVIPPTGPQDSLKFDYAYATYINEKNDRLEIDYSLDSGRTFSMLILLNGGINGELVTAQGTANSFIPTASQWGTKNISLPLGTNKIKFKAISANGNNLYLDNIIVGPVNLNDVGVFSIDMSSSLVAGTISARATIKNYGSLAQSSVPVTMIISPGNYTSSKTISTLNPGTSKQALFDNWVAAAGIYNIKVFTLLPGDTNSFNDTATIVVTVSKTGWVQMSNINVPTVMGSGCTAIINDTPYVFSIAGNTVNGTEVNKYNFISDKWIPLAPFPSPRYVMSSTFAQEKIFVFGGIDYRGYYIDTVYSFDIKNNSWSYINRLPTKLAWSKACSFQDSLIYIAGGYDSLFNHVEVLLYNVNNNSFRKASSLPIPPGTWGGAMAISGNTIVYVGGFVYNVGIVASTYVGIISETDRSQISWSVKSPYPGGPRYTWDAGEWRDGIIVSGGRSSQYNWTAFGDCYVYNVQQDNWIQQPAKPTAVVGASVGSFQLPDGRWRYVMASGVNGSSMYPFTEVFYDDTFLTAIKNNDINAPLGYSLSQNYPNPFNPDTKIRFSLPASVYVTLDVYNIIGQKVTSLLKTQLEAGNHEVTFNGANLSSGIYFYELRTGNYISTKKMILIK